MFVIIDYTYYILCNILICIQNNNIYLYYKLCSIKQKTFIFLNLYNFVVYNISIYYTLCNIILYLLVCKHRHTHYISYTNLTRLKVFKVSSKKRTENIF